MIRTHSTPRGLVASLTLDILAAAAASRQGAGDGAGERPASGLARDPVVLGEVVELRRTPDGRQVEEPLTEPGTRTALRREPPILAKLSRHDGRRLAALAYASAVERVGAVRGASLGPEAPGGSSAEVPDGGAATRAQQAGMVRLARGTVNRWKWSRARRAYVEGPARVILRPSRGAARPITATELLDAIAIEGLDMAAILRRAGWSAHSKHRKALTESAAEMLTDLADAMGYGNRVSRP
ncbi:hypothetical protein [Rhodovulum marinum]|uniref:Uncharacterized protein n=1 Tax=Rhodovulum marinum TaxID=320662 RepID=A0A4R2QAU6_9RHOB|nr:hypothetical protein [Rhodovulum marinum]TCP43945.1 hypothetical protein EV662_10128 [Rhodovulum marinum]